jgi:diguanylate cyclase (GGDEF)-like protein
MPENESGVRLKVESKPELPQLWKDDENTEVTNTTQLVAAAMRSAGRPRLTVMTGTCAGHVASLDEKEEFAVGRAREADVRLDDQGVSRQHCRFIRNGDGFLVEDLGSTNGTIVNGKRISRPTQLHAGDRVQLGPHAVLQLTFYDAAEETLARRLFDASIRDPLTRAFNRRHFFQRLDTEVSYARRHKMGLSVMVLDLDYFKSINDTAGHIAGDAVLCAVANEIARCVRAEDVFARYGGEEFVLLARGTLEETRRFGERIRSRIEALRIQQGDRTLSVTVSIGIGELEEAGPQGSGADLVALSDRRLYRAKLLGRNRVCSA